MTPRIKCSSLGEYLQLEFKEILQGDNPWFTGIKVGHPPTRQECSKHYTENHGDENFGRRYYFETEESTPDKTQ